MHRYLYIYIYAYANSYAYIYIYPLCIYIYIYAYSLIPKEKNKPKDWCLYSWVQPARGQWCNLSQSDVFHYICSTNLKSRRSMIRHQIGVQRPQKLLTSSFSWHCRSQRRKRAACQCSPETESMTIIYIYIYMYIYIYIYMYIFRNIHTVTYANLSGYRTKHNSKNSATPTHGLTEVPFHGLMNWNQLLKILNTFSSLDEGHTLLDSKVRTSPQSNHIPESLFSSGSIWLKC